MSHKIRLERLSAMQEKKEKRVLQSIERAVSILDYLVEYPGGVRLTTLSRALNLNKSTVFSLISSLEELRLVQQDEETGKYSLGIKLLQYGSAVEKNMNIISCSQSYLDALTEKYGVTAHLGVLSGTNIVYIARAESTKSIHVATRVGATMPVYCSALGKVLLAFLPKAKLFSLLAEINFERYTQYTITTPEELLVELKQIRFDSCAYDREESELGLVCAAAPIFNSQNQCVGAISISMSKAKSESIGEEELGHSVAETAKMISEKLGSTLTLL